MFEAYLDIETTGLVPSHHRITVVGLYMTDGNSGKMTQLVGHRVTKANLMHSVKGAEIIYTYNGSRFDIPFIRTGLGVDLLSFCEHHDLMLDCWSRRLFGGLKVVEGKLGIERTLKDVNGLEAIRLWRKYEKEQDLDSLSTLLKYNQEDVLNLKILREKLCPQPAR